MTIPWLAEEQAKCQKAFHREKFEHREVTIDRERLAAILIIAEVASGTPVYPPMTLAGAIQLAEKVP